MPPHLLFASPHSISPGCGLSFRVGRKLGVQLLLFFAQGNAPIGLLRYVAHGPRLLLIAVAWFLLQRNGCFRLEVFYGD